MNHYRDPEGDTHDALQARLRGLPAHRPPPADGWTRLQAALPPREAATPLPHAAGRASGIQRGRRRLRWSLPAGAALAASLALYWVLPLSLPRHAAPAGPSALQVQANVMTEEYQQAMAALPVVGAPEWQPALAELDLSADQIRAALSQSPRSRLLLGQLQRTYALRLQLTRQAAMASAGLPT